MCSFKLTQWQYAPQKVVETIRDEIQYSKECHLTDISRVCLHYTISIIVRYEVHRYMSIGLLPFEEFCKEGPLTYKVES